jgi:hypothetical protein
LGLLLALGGCASVDYASLRPGSFTGRVFVMWVGEGGSSGDGNFLFVPDPDHPLIFRRKDSASPGAYIQPGMMYTDGGSIPRIAQVFKGLSPWGYAPAYMIHDWLFVARHCIVDKKDDGRFKDVSNVDFPNSVEILGEAIKALIASNQVKKDDVAASAITTAVGSFVAKNQWDAHGQCEDPIITIRPEDLAQVNAALPGVSQARLLRTFNLAPGTPRVNPGRPAKIIATVDFAR